MSFDFFNEGLKKETVIQFTKEENTFLESKLPFLDPKKTQQISIGSALQFLKFSGIRSEGIQKILKNCKVENLVGKKTISYNEMKKIFRGVALHQADIEPSTINIQANIKTKMPIFYDDQSDDQEPHPPNIQPTKVQQLPKQKQISEPVQVRPVQDNPQTKQKPVQDKTNAFSFQAPVKPSVHYPPQQPPQVQAPSQNPKEKQNGLTIKIRQFEARWVKLKTEGNKISGTQVKTLCKNLGQRSNLSKAWKLCCHTHSGALSKGEFFVFLQIVVSPQIPETLTQEMKQCIAFLDQPQQKESKPQSLAPQQVPQKLASSMIFQNFGKADSSVEVRGRVKTEEKLDLSQLKDISKTQSQLQDAAKITENHSEELTLIRRGQETMNNLLGEVERFLSSVESKNSETKEHIEDLKNNQQLLNDRLNRVCIALNGIIVSQNTIIEQLVSESANQNNISLQRINFLENHVIQLTEQLKEKELTIKKMLQKKQQHQQEVSPSPPQLKQPSQEQAELQTHPEQVSPEKKREIPLQRLPSEVPEQQKSPQFNEQQHSPPAKEYVEARVEKPEDSEYQQRMKMKRAQVIQLIMHLTPLTPEEEPALIQRIREYNEEELNTVYFNCFQKLKARQQAQQKGAAAATQKGPGVREGGGEDEFSSSNFHGQPSSSQQDMFS